MPTNENPHQAPETLVEQVRATPPPGERMHPLELLTLRESLGLTRETLAATLGVSLDSVASWELGRRTIPDGVRNDVKALESYTTDLAAALAAQLAQSPSTASPTLTVYARDAELTKLHLPDAPLTPTARWWRAVAYQVAQRVPGLRLTGPTKKTQTKEMPMTIIDPALSPLGVPAPELVYAGELRVLNNLQDEKGTAERYPVEVWRACNGEIYAIVTAVPVNSPLSALSENIAATIREKWSAYRIIEHYPHGRRGRRFVESDGEGGWLDLDFQHWADLGFLFLDPHTTN